MNTISGPKSLILFEQNRNRSNIFSNDQDPRLLLKEHYFNVFNNIAEKFSDGQRYGSFVKIWYSIVDAECVAVYDTMESYTGDVASINLVVNKFRGNLGEIFAEKIFKSGKIALVDAEHYDTVDPNNERFLDATGINSNTGLPMGIQVKNYKFGNNVSGEIFCKAAAEAGLAIFDGDISQNDLSEYTSMPHEMIFSFTDVVYDLLKEQYKNTVIFFGPRDIDKLGLQGNKDIIPNARFFRQIADEIAAFE